MNINVVNENDDVISVSQLNKMAKSVLESYLPIVWVKGEISGLKRYAHLYFDLKDEGAKVSCVMFAKLAELVDFEFDNGAKVEVRGRVTLYPQNGSYQINVERIRKVGLGELWEAYNKLVVKLREEGLFDQKYKKPLPVMPRAIGVVTSKEGAVIRDVITTLKRRTPHIPIVIYHAAVQGSDSAMQIAKAIRLANQRQEVDVLIVCRGGGSMEDLWSFNEEIVAREVFQSELPIISAVGHETDTTIIDFVSDLRAPTPTAAAELVATSSQEWLHKLDKYLNSLKQHMDSCLNDYYQKLDLYLAKLNSFSPKNHLSKQQQTLKFNQELLEKSFSRYIKSKIIQLEHVETRFAQVKLNIDSYQEQLNNYSNKLDDSFALYLENLRNKLNNFQSILEAMSPYKVLQRGYAIVQDNNGKILKSVLNVKHHSKVNITLADGEVSAIIDKKTATEQSELL